MDLQLILMLSCFGLFMFFGMPLAFCMLFSSLLFLLATKQPVYILVHQMFTGVDTFTLMAIPFFMLAGELMVYSGTVEKVLNLCNVFVGRFRGGLAYVNVLDSMLFGGCSGSAIADVAGLGPLEWKMMQEGGYGKGFSVALTVSSSIQGPMIPPSIPLVLVGAVTGTSIGGLLLGGAIPGVLIGVFQCAAVFLIAKKRNFPRFEVKLGWVEKIKVVIGSVPFLLMPLIIIGGIIGGFFTPTEASTVAVAYGLLLILANRRGKIDAQVLVRIFIRAGVLSASILLLSSASSVFSWILATKKVPDMVGTLLFSMTHNPYLILLVINIFLLVYGMFMDSLPAILIIFPILFPLVTKLGIHPIHFGVVVTYNLIIGLITPPYGAALFTGSVVSGLPIEDIVREMLPFLMSSIVILFLITYIPWLVMYLPTIAGMAK